MEEPTEPALGVVVDAGRDGLPYELIHGEALVGCAAWALGEAEVHLLDLGTPWAAILAAEEPLVLHDALCPMTPADFIVTCIEQAVADDAVAVGVRPVTDTVKTVEDGVLGQTLDREDLVAICSPIVVPVSVLVQIEPLMLDQAIDFADLVSALAARFAVVQVAAPASARRVTSREDIRVLEAFTTPE